MKTLHLNLKRKWFGMIVSGEKTEEYREIKPYWDKVFIDGKIKIKGKLYHPTNVIICFSNGYAKDRRQEFYLCYKVRVSTGRPEWGAVPGKQYHVISLCGLMPF